MLMNVVIVTSSNPSPLIKMGVLLWKGWIIIINIIINFVVLLITRYLVSHLNGVTTVKSSQIFINLLNDRDLNFLPCVATAMPLDTQDCEPVANDDDPSNVMKRPFHYLEDDGRVFSFLPLPLDKNGPSGEKWLSKQVIGRFIQYFNIISTIRDLSVILLYYYFYIIILFLWRHSLVIIKMTNINNNNNRFNKQ